MTAAVRTRVRPAAPRASVSLGAALAATLGALIAAALLEAAVYGHGGHDALSDIPGRFLAWHVHPSLLPYQQHPIEYPVVVGYATWLTAWFGRGATGFFVATGLLGAGLLAFDRRRDRTSGALLALGAFTKVFPALFLPPLAFLRWRAEDVGECLRV